MPASRIALLVGMIAALVVAVRRSTVKLDFAMATQVGRESRGSSDLVRAIATLDDGFERSRRRATLPRVAV